MSEGHDDRGMISAFVAVLTAGMIFVAGMAYDGGQRITTYMRASDLAANAARAAAQSADLESLYGSGPARLDSAEAQAAAESFLVAAGYPGSMASFSVTGNEVTVSVRLTHTAVILDWVSTPDIHATATSTAVSGADSSTGGP